MLYIHIPYCKGKCIYCDFYSGGNPDWEKYLKAVASELSERIEELRGDCLSSIYIGGGTPSLIPDEDFGTLVSDIKTILQSNNIALAKDLEFTVEVNPEDVSLDKAITWKNHGVNRISMGVQSMVDEELQLLKRRHNAEKVEFAIKILKQHFNNINLDLIYGIPGQTEKSLKESLEKLIFYGPEHISAYALSYEPHTPLSILRDRGKIIEQTEDNYLIFGEIVSEMLEHSGYERYEISNYSKPGFKSRHNSGYWTGKKYLGLGPSASSYNGSYIRRTNFADVKGYIKSFINFNRDTLVPDRPKMPIYTEEKLSAKERLTEIIMVGLRTKDGIDFKKLDSHVIKDLLFKAERWIKSGDLIINNDCLSLTGKGISISDYIILSLV